MGDHPTSWGSDEVKEWLMRHAQDINSGQSLDATADLFEQGFDRWERPHLYSVSDTKC